MRIRMSLSMKHFKHLKGNWQAGFDGFLCKPRRGSGRNSLKEEPEIQESEPLNLQTEKCFKIPLKSAPASATLSSCLYVHVQDLYALAGRSMRQELRFLRLFRNNGELGIGKAGSSSSAAARFFGTATFSVLIFDKSTLRVDPAPLNRIALLM